MRLIPLAALLCLISVAASAQLSDERLGYPPPTFEQRPRSGVGGVVVGSAALGMALLNVATLPICFADFYPSGAQDGCVIGSLALAGVDVVVGVPSLVLGLIRLRRYRDWKQQRALALVERLGAGASPSGATLRYTLRF